jgi:lysozyme family protein
MKFTAKLAKEYESLWNGLSVAPARAAEARKYAQKILDNKTRYQAIEDQTGVPWHFVGLVHYRESTLNFNKNLANGQPLSMRTTIVPKGRGPYATFEQSAVDSLVNVQKYRVDRDWSLPMYLWTIEGYNGYGYHYKNIPSPYLVGGSNKQKRGKYIADGVYDPGTWDTQLGVLTILKALQDLDPTVSFSGPVRAVPDTAPEAEDEKDNSFKTDAEPKTNSSAFWRQLSIIGGTVASLFAGIEYKTVIALGVVGISAYAVWVATGKPKFWKGEF